MFCLLKNHLLVDGGQGFCHALQLLIAVPDVALALWIVRQCLGPDLFILAGRKHPVLRQQTFY